MKRVHVLSLAMVICLIFTGMSFAQTKEDIHLHKACKYCGMDRGMHDFSRMLIEYDDGSNVAFCSIRCAGVDLANNIDKTPVAIKVGDFNSKQLIDAEKAFWVIGGNKPGVMSRRGKWAFDKKDDAESFIKTNQGKLASFEDAMKMAYEDMAEDTKMIRERRKMKRAQMMEQKPGAGH
jgi:copper chaperone NosL